VARVFLIGDPVSHSLSPAMQNAAFAALGLPHRYELLRLPAADVGEFVRTGLRSEDVLGANVTIPHKEIVAGHLDGVEETARRIGAVNTIFKRGSALRGDNTDAGGFSDALAERGIDPSGRRVLVLGAGGAAKACIDQVFSGGAAAVCVATRTHDPERFQGIVRAAMSTAGRRATLEPVAWPVRDLTGYEILVNATSLGMHGESALDGVALSGGLAVVDIVATAAETPLVKRARAAGCVVVDGLLMLLHQGTRAFRLWTEREAPIEVMRAALPRAV
jgi:shikimate dehydrogenase